MKRSILSLVVAFLMILAVPAYSSEETKATEAETTEMLAEIASEVKSRVDRLNEIKVTDFSELDASEKKELRKEVRTISKELKALGKADSEARANSEATAQGTQTGIYISGSAIIIILLLLLIL